MEQYEDQLTVCPHCGFQEGTESDNPLHMATGSILADRYVIGRVIGFGGFGVTYIAWDALLEMKVAIKEYLPSEFSTRVLGHNEVTVFGGDKQEQFSDGMSKFIDEAKKLAKFHATPGIVKIFDSFECNNTAYIIMELLQGETLAEILKREKRIPEDKAIQMMIPIIKSLEDVHKDGIIHRDIAPDNIFVTEDGEVKLIDFGAARYATTTHSRSLTVIIKPGYSPEEQYRSRGDQGPYTDVYAVAATMYKMITGETPPDALERRAFFENKRKDILQPLAKFDKNIDLNHENAILNALNIRVEDRTPDMTSFLYELTTNEPVKRRAGKINPIDTASWPIWAKIGVPAAAALIAVFTILITTGIISFGKNLDIDTIVEEGEARVPNVVGQDYSAAQELFEEKGLIMKIYGKSFSDFLDENLILDQAINVGAVVPRNTVVNVKVSSGQMIQYVPNLIGMDAEMSEKKLKELDFQVKTVEEYSDVIAEGGVIAQSEEPYAGIDDGSEITLTVSKGRDPAKKTPEKEVTVTELKGKKFDDVLAEAEKQGFVIIVSSRIYDEDSKRDIVLSQSAEKDSKVKNTEPVVLTASLGYDKVQVPDLIFQTEKKAKSQLLGRGLYYKIVHVEDDTVAAGLVIGQSPDSGSMLNPEDDVELKVSTGSKKFAMPNVVGQQQNDAKNTLEGQGLVVSLSLKQDDSKKEGEVLGQSVKAGSDVRPGDEVVLTICTHSAVIKVPDVVGKSQTDAEKALKNAGFKVKINKSYSNTVAKGMVISQNPSAGSGSKKDATITINVSDGRQNTNVVNGNSETAEENENNNNDNDNNNNNNGGNNNASTASSAKNNNQTTQKTPQNPSVSSKTPSSKPVQPDPDPTPAPQQEEPEYSYTYYFLAPDNYFLENRGAFNGDVGAYWWIDDNNGGFESDYWPGTRMSAAPEVGNNVFKITNVTSKTDWIVFNSYISNNTGTVEESLADLRTVNIDTHGYHGNCPYNSGLNTDNFDGWIYVLNNNLSGYNNEGVNVTEGAWFRLDDYMNYDEYYGSYSSTRYRKGDIITVDILLGNVTIDGEPAGMGAMNYELYYDSNVLEYQSSESDNKLYMFNPTDHQGTLKMAAMAATFISFDYSRDTKAPVFHVYLKVTEDTDTLGISGECTSLTAMSEDSANAPVLIGRDNDGDSDYYTGYTIITN